MVKRVLTVAGFEENKTFKDSYFYILYISPNVYAVNISFCV